MGMDSEEMGTGRVDTTDDKVGTDVALVPNIAPGWFLKDQRQMF